LDNNPFALFRHVYKLNGDVLFRITAMGAQAAASFVFDQWHASLNNVNTIARITALFSGTMDANGYTFIDHRRVVGATTVYGLHAELVKAGFMPQADYDPTLSSNGFARTIDATVEYQGVVSPVIAYGVSNTIYKAVTVYVSQAGQFQLTSFPSMHCYDMPGFPNYLSDGAAISFPVSAGIGLIWGLKVIGDFWMRSNDGLSGRCVIQSISSEYCNYLNASLKFDGNTYLTGLNIFSGTGSFSNIELQNTQLGTGDDFDLVGYTCSSFTLNLYGLPYGYVRPPAGGLKDIIFSYSNAIRSILWNGTTYVANYYYALDNLPNMTIAVLDGILVTLDGLTPGVATGTIDLSGTTPGPTGGAANANVLSLQAKGITVNL